MIGKLICKFIKHNYTITPRYNYSCGEYRIIHKRICTRCGYRHDRIVEREIINAYNIV